MIKVNKLISLPIKTCCFWSLLVARSISPFFHVISLLPPPVDLLPNWPPQVSEDLSIPSFGFQLCSGCGARLSWALLPAMTPQGLDSRQTSLGPPALRANYHCIVTAFGCYSLSTIHFWFQLRHLEYVQNTDYLFKEIQIMENSHVMPIQYIFFLFTFT